MDLGKYSIEALGQATMDNPIGRQCTPKYITDEDCISYDPYMSEFKKVMSTGKLPEAFETAGPRKKIFFNPSRTKVAIVTCGGLCPGLNAVVRGIVMELWHRYGCQNIVGVPYGYQGLGANAKTEFMVLKPDIVKNIHEEGGTFLGSSRGVPPVSEMVDVLERFNINILFTLGGDGTMRGANEIWQEVKKRNLKIAIVGIPKTIDNDIMCVRRSFGFDSAVERAADAIYAANIEAEGAINGIGLVKLMGRDSGFIAATVTLATGHVNFCLIPEVQFRFEGANGLLELLKKRIEARGHAVVVVAEGAGQDLFVAHKGEKDASGNAKFEDIGLMLKDKITKYFKEINLPVSLKYIDPSYIIRANPPNPADKLLCARFAQNAVHAAMCGKTGMLIGSWHGTLTHVPFTAVIGQKQKVNPNGEMWFNVLETTGQPAKIG